MPITTTAVSNGVFVDRWEMPPLPVPDPALGAAARIDRFDTYGVVRCGEMYAEVQRFAYWDETYDEVEVVFEARIYELPEHSGSCDVYSADPSQLLELGQICVLTAMLLGGAQRMSFAAAAGWLQ